MSGLSSTLTHPARLERIREVCGTLLGVAGQQAGARVGLVRPDGPSPAQAFATALEGLGCTFVKLGQTLSTREDLLPAEYVAALARLRDDVEAMEWSTVAQVLEEAYGEPASAVFASIDPAPVGSASVGQVHRATLWDGRHVAVKVQRPGAREQVERDLSILLAVTGSLDGIGAFGDRLRTRDLVDTFGTGLRLELDYRVEARNLRRLRRGTAGHALLMVPRPVSELTRQTVLVMDFVEGRPLSEHQGGVPNGTELARQLCASYLDQILDEGFFHADPHPGNLLLTEEGRLVLIDLGLVETVDADERALIAQLVLAVAEGDSEPATEALEALCSATPDRDPEGLRFAVQRTIRNATALRGIEPTFGVTVYAMLRACTDHGYRAPSQLASLARTLSMLDDGIQRLDPELDPGTVIRERAGRLARERMVEDFGGLRGANGLLLAQLASRAPRRLGQALDQLATGRLELRIDAFDEYETLTSIRKIANRIAGALIVAALLLAGAMLADAPPLGFATPGGVLLALGGMGAATLLASILWFDR